MSLTGQEPSKASDFAILAVERLYLAAFGRLADLEGLAYFGPLMAQGLSPADLARSLAATDEFRARHGDAALADPTFLARAYQDALGRLPSEVERSGWLERELGPVERSEVLATLAGMPEARIHCRKLRLARHGAPGVPDDPQAYQHWVRDVDYLDEADQDAIRADILGRPDRPLISLVLDAAVPAESRPALERTIASVRAQLYPDWELLAVGAVPGTLDGDSRIRVLKRARSLNPWKRWPGVALEAAYRKARGAFVCLLDPGDILAVSALYKIAAMAIAHPEAQLIFTDEDELDDAGQRVRPCFKPGWNPVLLQGTNTVGRLAAYRPDAIRRAGGLRTLPGELAEHVLALRATAGLAPGAVQHVSSVLVHRLPPPAPVEDRAAMLGRYFRSRGVHASVSPAPDYAPACRIAYALPARPPLVSAIVPTRDQAELLRACAEGLLHRTDYPALELIVVDNGSRDPTTLHLLSMLGADPRVRVHPFPAAFNWSAMNNEAARLARGDVLLLLNDDVAVLDPGWLRELVSHAVRPDVGVVGAKLLYSDMRLQHGGIALGPAGRATHLLRFAARHDPGYLGQLATARNLTAVTGACLAIRRAVFQQVGGLEETELRVTWSDIDLCFRVQAQGYQVVWTPFAELLHKELATRGTDDRPETAARFRAEQEYMRRRWGAMLDRDPYLNHNLQVTETELVLRVPDLPAVRLVPRPASPD